MSSIVIEVCADSDEAEYKTVDDGWHLCDVRGNDDLPFWSGYKDDSLLVARQVGM